MLGIVCIEGSHSTVQAYDRMFGVLLLREIELRAPHSPTLRSHPQSIRHHHPEDVVVAVIQRTSCLPEYQFQCMVNLVRTQSVDARARVDTQQARRR